jgi:hypothetical protein
MKYQFIQKVIENLDAFEANNDLFGKLKGCSETELQELNAYYNHQLPSPLLEIMAIGGYNFFAYYLGIEWNTGYSLWKTIQKTNYREMQNDFPSYFEEVPQKLKFYIGTVYSPMMLYCPLFEGDNPKVYEVRYEPIGSTYIETIAYEKLTDLIDAIVTYQMTEYAKFLERKPLKYADNTIPKKYDEIPFGATDDLPF